MYIGSAEGGPGAAPRLHEGAAIGRLYERVEVLVRLTGELAEAGPAAPEAARVAQVQPPFLSTPFFLYTYIMYLFILSLLLLLVLLIIISMYIYIYIYTYTCIYIYIYIYMIYIHT